MTCKQSEFQIASYADRELDVLRALLIKSHLRGCAGCAGVHEGILTLRSRIRAEATYFSAPPTLKSGARTMVDALRGLVPPRSCQTSDRWRSLGSGVVVGCAASAFAWTIGTTVIAWRASGDVALAAVAAHIRATHSDHLIEVASSDRHTVKPWLSARLDYSPPVQNLADEGFTLIGGRLDYLARRPVATLVYRSGGHTIDVFVQPYTSLVPTPALRAVRGFNVAYAKGPSMEWLAVSDADSSVLSTFIQRLSREDVPQ